MDDHPSCIELFGIPINAVTLEDAIETIHEWMEKPIGCHIVATANPEFIIEAINDESFHAILQKQSSLVLADGVGILLAERIICGSRTIPERVSGIDVVVGLARRCRGHQRHRWYLLGGERGSGICAAAEVGKYAVVAGSSEELMVRQNGHEIVYNKEVNDRIIHDINACQASIVLVAFGHSKQEKWIHENKDRMPSVRVFIGVGGSFDFIAGRIKRAPTWMRIIGLEWLWRLLIEPWRIKRIWNATVLFMFETFKQRLQK